MKRLTEKKTQDFFSNHSTSFNPRYFFFVKQNSTFIETIKKTRTKKKKYLFITIAVYCQIVPCEFRLIFFQMFEQTNNEERKLRGDKRKRHTHT